MSEKPPSVGVRLRDLAEAFSDPWLAPRLGYSINQAYAAARGLGNGISAHCATCRHPWGVLPGTRAPRAVAQVTAHGGVTLMLVCNGCAADPRTARHKLRKITKQGLRVVPVCALAPGGWA
jgi:hypothetical protein